MDSSRLSTGYHDIDERIEGGIPQNTVVAYTGVSGTAKQEAGMRYIQQGLINGENCLIISTKYTPTQYRNLGSKYGIELSGCVFLDAVSWRLRRVNPKLETRSEYEVSNLSDLNALLSLVMKIFKQKRQLSRVFFDSPTSLLLYSTPGVEQVYKFFELLTAHMRSNGITFVYSLEEEVHPSEVKNTLLYLSDGHFVVERNNHRVEITPKFMALTDI